MPELPEVQTVVNQIRSGLLNAKVDSLTPLWPKVFHNFTIKKVKQQLKGKLIINVSRRAKYIIISLNQGYSIIAHLGMSGSYKVLKKNVPQDYNRLKHDHLVIELDNFILVYNDPRRFGYIDLTNKETEKHKFLSLLGPEPLSNSFN